MNRHLSTLFFATMLATFFYLRLISVTNNSDYPMKSEMAKLTAKKTSLRARIGPCKTKLFNLTNLMQERIDQLQNPADCEEALKLICNMIVDCGFGCQMHHIARCLVLAYGFQRTAIIITNQHSFFLPTQWTSAFRPITESCANQSKFFQSDEGEIYLSQKPNVSMERDADARELTYVPANNEFPGRWPPFLPRAIPKDIAEDLIFCHGNPPAWFMGQFLFYLMRSSATSTERLSAAERKIPFHEGPIVGLQIRRTDKIQREAKYHNVTEYMKWAEKWFTEQSLKQNEELKNRIFISTDDPNAISEIRKLYPNVTFFADVHSASIAGPWRRTSDESFYGTLTDIHLLSKCDYVVGTFSSNIGRLAYELMQVVRSTTDASSLFQSLDSMYYYDFEQGTLALVLELEKQRVNMALKEDLCDHEQEAILSHTTANKSEIELRIGDIIILRDKYWDGYSKGKNKRTGKEGRYPSDKVKDKWRIVDFSNYSHKAN